MSAPLLSTVTVAFNAAATIERTIESVRAQTFRDREHLVIDGGSTDGTLAILRRHEPALRWISEPDGGIYDAMNKGVRLARGRWIHLLNADDEYAAPDVLAQAVPQLDPSRTNYTDIEIVAADGRRWVQRFPFRRWKLAYGAFLPHPGLVVARAQYEATGDYDTRLRIAADHDLILRLLRRYPPRRIPVVMTVMHQGGASARQLRRSADEFRDVAVAHGQPRWLAHALHRVKRWRWGV
jgi:glycosyltransferase involved in cell wall biosynthesis